MLWILLALLSGIGAAMLAIIVKAHLKHFNSFFIFFLFALVTLILLFAIDLGTNKIECKLITSLSSKDWLVLFAAGCLNTFAFICYLSALKCGPTGGVIALDRLGIVFALVLAAIFLQESFSIKSIIGSILMILGAILIGS
jgi:bacterial/archaeal transporter family protein